MAASETRFRSFFELKKDRTQKEEEILFLGFTVGDQSYATKIPFVKEILKVPRLYSMPQVPGFVKGVMDLRGAIIPVTDLKERLGLGSVETKTGRVVVVMVEKKPMGILVDSVLEVFSIPQAEVKSAPEVFQAPHMVYLEGMVRKDDRLYLLLNPRNILSPKEMQTLEKSDWDSLPIGARKRKK